jgi:antitoxin component YwqK of YwqJK toxin-antitoxin module
MNHQDLNKAIKIILGVLLLSILAIVLLYLNIGRDFQKQVESGQLRPVSGEGLGILGMLLYYFLGYLLIFIGWLIALIINKDTTNNGSKQTQLIIIIIFSIFPTTLVLFFMCKASPNPFKNHTYTKTSEHEIRNGKIIRYSSDSVIVFEATILNDQKVGKEITRYENGVTASENNYIENVLHGESISYNQNGIKQSVTTYLMGQTTRSCKFYENGQMSYLFDEDSAYSRYEWWENGQLKARYHNTPSDYWEADGKQTLFNGNGTILIRDKTSGRKLQETTYENNNVIKEISWYSFGLVSRVGELVRLSEKESKAIGCEEGAFSGYMDLQYHTNGRIGQIDYKGTTGIGKSFRKTIRYDRSGELLPN